MEPVCSVIWSAMPNWHMCSPKLWFKLQGIYASKRSFAIFSDSCGMKVPIDNAVLHRYINKALNSFRLLENPSEHIPVEESFHDYVWGIHWSTDFSIKVSEFTQNRKYGPEALQPQSLAVFQKCHFHKLSWCQYPWTKISMLIFAKWRKKPQKTTCLLWMYHCITIVLNQAIIWWIWRLM